MRDGELRLSDFGLTTSLNIAELSLASSLGTPGRGPGTPPYMVPEQALRDVPEQTADVYSLGILLAELCVGKKPESNLAVNEGSTLQAWKPLKDLPPSLRRFILRLTDKDPKKRPSSGQAVHDEFGRLVDKIITAVPVVA